MKYASPVKYGFGPPIGISIEDKTSSDPRDQLIQEAAWNWSSYVHKVRLDEKSSCREKADQFEKKLKEVKESHNGKGLSIEVSTGLLGERASLYTRNLQRVYPESSPAERRVDDFALNRRSDLEKVPKNRFAACQKLAEGHRQGLEHLKDRLQRHGDDPALTEWTIQEKRREYTYDFQRQCLPSASREDGR
jgi:hypothetical protein